jgi:hypothetical protein
LTATKPRRGCGNCFRGPPKPRSPCLKHQNDCRHLPLTAPRTWQPPSQEQDAPLPITIDQHMSTITIFDSSDVNWQSDRGLNVTSEDELRSAVDERKKGEPRIFDFLHSVGSTLQLGLGGPYACAQFIPSHRATSWDARAEPVRAADDIEFLLGGTPTPVAPEYCLEPGEALRVAQHFFQNGEMAPWIKWHQG